MGKKTRTVLVSEDTAKMLDKLKALFWYQKDHKPTNDLIISSLVRDKLKDIKKDDDVAFNE